MVGLFLLLMAIGPLECLGSSSQSPESPCPGSPLPSGQPMRIWKNNQTHELYLPISVEEGCGSKGGGCVTWDASVDVQSGDVLLVHVNDSLLIASAVPSQTLSTPGSSPPSTSTRIPPSTLPPPSSSMAPLADSPLGTTSSALPPSSQTTLDEETTLQETSPTPTAPDETLALYSVARPGSGPASCDVSDGVLLDISPLVVDGNKLVALYDKDLTEGVNLLIIVSGAWGSQCAKLKVTVKSENCGDNEDCSGKGLCYTNASMEGYECQCCPGYIGSHCEEKDACFPNPCTNNGICVDISQGHEGSTFQCLCPYGFTGKICEDTSDPCESGPCQHGGKCRSSNETAQQFKCDCPAGYSGPLCQHNLDACASNPCYHGICVDQDGGFRCYCQPGFTGNQCQDEYNECESTPCLNGGTCTDHIDSFACNCGRGYAGKRCQIKIDLCDPNPCSHHHYCIDKGNSYSCECPKGFTGPECLIPTRAACSANPCRNGGTCWSSVDSFYCACRPGFTGKICNEEVVIEVIPSAEDPMDLSGGDKSIELQMPVSIHLDHLHNVYVAAGTLACALLIVIVTVVICHCRMHETYKSCCFKSSPLLPCHITRFDAVLKKNSMEKDKEPLAQARPFPALDSSDMYYALDFSDSQSSPLIQ